jgi:hypothetical protein
MFYRRWRLSGVTKYLVHGISSFHELAWEEHEPYPPFSLRGDVCLMEDSYILVLDFILVYG